MGTSSFAAGQAICVLIGPGPHRVSRPGDVAPDAQLYLNLEIPAWRFRVGDHLVRNLGFVAGEADVSVGGLPLGQYSDGDGPFRLGGSLPPEITEPVYISQTGSAACRFHPSREQAARGIDPIVPSATTSGTIGGFSAPHTEILDGTGDMMIQGNTGTILNTIIPQGARVVTLAGNWANARVSYWWA